MTKTILSIITNTNFIYQLSSNWTSLIKSQGHPTTVFSKIRVRRSKYFISFSVLEDGQKFLDDRSVSEVSRLFLEYHSRLSKKAKNFLAFPAFSRLFRGKKAWKSQESQELRAFPGFFCRGTLSKRVVNAYFDRICHTEQRYGRNDNLTSFITLGETQIRWFFAQIYYPGQNCWKMSFAHFYYIKQKCGKLLLWPDLL